MDLVDELSFGVVQEYREAQKGRLQRTFVSGSAAAAGKVNRLPGGSHQQVQQGKTTTT
jgi:hypothetical protein